MKICSQCGQVNDDDARFCVRDGWELPDSVDETSQEDKPNSKVCEKCGFQNNSESKFCGGCGKPLAESAKKKEKRENIPGLVNLFSFLFVIIVGLCIAANTYDKDFSELFDDFIELFEEEKEYMNVSMHHSPEIDMDGETISFSIDTNAEWLEIENLEFRVVGRGITTWEAENGNYYSEYDINRDHYFDWNRDFLIHPIANVEFLGNRDFKVTINKNRGYNRQFVLVVKDPEVRVSKWEVRIYQKGYKGRVKR